VRTNQLKPTTNKKPNVDHQKEKDIRPNNNRKVRPWQAKSGNKSSSSWKSGQAKSGQATHEHENKSSSSWKSGVKKTDFSKRENKSSPWKAGGVKKPNFRNRAS
jgi:hypothetical protein